MSSDTPPSGDVAAPDPDGAPLGNDHNSLKYHLLGPSLTKAGQDTVDQTKVCAFS
jgi:DNA polymerase kappa